MKKILLFWLIFLILPFRIFAQPIISYILPDIGTPDLNTYIEIIGPSDLVNNFGNDGFYLNNSGDAIRLEVVNPLDSQKIIFGPIVVSWEGRMISSQVFVHPKANPNSWDWQQLLPEYRIPIRVLINGNYSNIDTFYIVKPFPMGNIQGNPESILGQGALGKRSRRGAMIIDSAIFGNKTYTVSLNDCDPYNHPDAGNQAYLPFVLIAKGSITGGANTLIDVSGGFGRVQDAGPGGGGGGGRFHDVGMFDDDIGDDGGNGFVGGGPGGRNNSGIPGKENKFKNSGIGSGGSANSLNETPAPVQGLYESSAGGTGHPFGKSGEPCFDGNTCEPFGGYGGGAGNKQNQTGGSAGYGIDGTGINNSKGLIYGNTMIVPIAGGSGGASGNPQGYGTYSGSGGGGGGAISIYGRDLHQISLKANGANGANGDGNGGNGSGGSIIASTKLIYDNSSLEISGGKNGSQNGGYGRVRFNYGSQTNLSLITPNAAPYYGFSTDTSSNVFRSFNLTGNKPSGKSLKLYLKPENGVWSQIADITTPGQNWTERIILPAPDTLFFLAAVMDIENPDQDPYRAIPPAIFSQSGANIFKYIKQPELVGDSIINARFFECENFPKTLKATISNFGESNLDLQFQNAIFSLGNKGFSLISPTGMLSLAPDSSVDILVEFNPANTTQRSFTDTLKITHNNFLATNPWKIAFTVNIDTVLLTAQNVNRILPITGSYHGLDTIDLGEICIGEPLPEKFILQNFSSYFINLTSITFEQNLFSIFNALPIQLDYNDPSNRMDLNIFLNTPLIGKIQDKMTIKIAECAGFSKTFIVKAFIKNIDLAILGNFNFGTVSITTTKTEQFKIVNHGTGPAYIDANNALFLQLNNEFQIININPALPVLLRPLVDTLMLYIQFTPSGEGIFLDTLSALSSLNMNACPDTIVRELSANVVSSKILVSTNLIDFGLTGKCGDIMQTFYIKNLETATQDLIITKSASIGGADIANFIISQEPSPIPYTIKPGDSVTYFVRYIADAGNEGVKTAHVTIETDSPTNPIITIDLTGEREDLKVTITPSNDIYLGDIYAGFDFDTTLTLTNSGRLQQKVSDVLISNPDIKVFPFGGILLPNSGNNLNFKFTTNSKIEGNQTVNVQFIFNDPCRDTIYATIHFNSLFANYTIPNQINFGTLSPCQSKSDTIYLENNSSAPFILKSIGGLQGTDFSLFTLSSNAIKLPDTLFAGESIAFFVNFDPQSSIDGNKSAYFEIDLYINGTDTTKRIDLIGERRSGFVVSPPELNFGNVVVNTQKTMSVVLENTGPWDVDFISIDFPQMPNFIVLNWSPQTLTPGNQFTLNVTFAPTAIMTYYDTITVHFASANCPEETRKILLIGNGVPAKIFNIWLPKLNVSNQEDNLHIPIFAKLDKQGDTLTNFKLDTMVVAFNRTIFYPENLSNPNAQIINNEIQNNLRVLTIEFNNVILSDKDTVLTDIIGKTMLGDIDTTSLMITKIAYKQIELVSEITFSDGSLQTPYCNRGGNRFLIVNPDGNAPIIQPNPTSGVIKIAYTGIESGQYSLSISDVKGISEQIANWEFQAFSSKNFEQVFDLRKYESGVYFIILRTPTNIFALPLIIIK
ncbi:choice-of-anchor D domain-containing protein [bacterium]|nr:choice-of-anchor D domain-containing protein [bacterium]